MLPKPFDSFRVEKHAGERKDFGLPENSTYPLKGVTYPVNYGEIEGYVAEDGAFLDVFMGTNGDLNGYIVVARPEVDDGEHKFYLYLTGEEEQALLKEFEPVLMEHGRFETYDELLQAIEPFRQTQSKS
jgi:hypothetical protein